MRQGRQVSRPLIGLLVLIVLAVVTVVTFGGLHNAPFKPGRYEVVADFEKAPQLRAGDQVRLEGNVEGEVIKIEPAPTPEEARVTMAIEEDAGPVYANASARLSAKTLLAGSFYVAIDRGEEQAGPLGDEIITSDHTTVQVEVEDVTDIFRDGAVQGMKTLPGEFSTALSDPVPPAEALRIVNDIAEDAGVALEALRGQRPGDDIPDLVDATARTVGALDSETDSLHTLVSGAAATLEVTGNRAEELRATIDAGPSVTYDLTNTLRRLDGTLEIADGLVARLEPAAPLLAPTLSELRPTLVATDELLQIAEPELEITRPAAIATGKFSNYGNTLIKRLEPSIERVDETILPYLSRKDERTGKSTTVMIGGTAAGFGGASAQQDANGHFIRFPATVGTSSFYIPCSTALIDPTANQLLACDAFNAALSTYLEYLPDVPGLLSEGGDR